MPRVELLLLTILFLLTVMNGDKDYYKSQEIRNLNLPWNMYCWNCTIFLEGSQSTAVSVPDASHHYYGPRWNNTFPGDAFIVTPFHGFLPKEDPLDILPREFYHLESVLRRMPAGLLSDGFLGQEIPNIRMYNVSSIKDTRLLQALYRDYSFLTSAYLLEPCDIQFRRSGKVSYGLGRSSIPSNIAIPFVQVARRLDAVPFLDYASYALYNWRRKDPAGPVDLDNLEIVRSFVGLEAEAGFIQVHLGMVAYSGGLVDVGYHIVHGARTRDIVMLTTALEKYRTVMQIVNDVMKTMWKRSNPAKFLDFRTFIMGVRRQPMFPHGIVYEGTDLGRMYPMGESAAMDSMIPLTDRLLQLTELMPINSLTQSLEEFRYYAPRNHRHFLVHVEKVAKQAEVRRTALSSVHTAVLYLKNLEQVRAFRTRHWNFAKVYIIGAYKHPVGTGGTPITTWLPNQLTTVLKAMIDCGPYVKENDEAGELIRDAGEQLKELEEEVKKLSMMYGVKIGNVVAPRY